MLINELVQNLYDLDEHELENIVYDLKVHFDTVNNDVKKVLKKMV
jgi:uncharacterized membrane protein